MMAAIPEETTGTKRRFAQDGFTLIELLVVIIILGILAAVAVFSIGGIGDTGQESACKVDTRTLETAEAAAFAKSRESTGRGEYITEAALVEGEFLSDPSSLHNIALTPVMSPQVTGTARAVIVTDKGALECVPNGRTTCQDLLATTEIEATPIAKPMEVGTCTDDKGTPDTDDDVTYPF